jgi:hypothetical protein
MKVRNYVYFESTPGAAGGGEPAAAPTAAPSPAPAPAPSAGPATAPVPAPAPAAAPPSALATGADPAAAPAVEAKPWDFIPEKFQVKNAEGTIDHEASARKVAEHRANLEKRLGAGDIRPATASEYKMPTLPEALKDAKMDDALLGQFREDAHKAGFSQSQFDLALGKYFELAPALVGAGQKFTADDTVADLKKTWGDNYQANSQNAWRGLTQIASVAGLTVEQVDSELGNSPAFNKIMAAVGAQMREDRAPNPQAGGGSGNSDAEAAKIQMSEAFRNPKHPEHAAASAKWTALVTKGVVNE